MRATHPIGLLLVKPVHAAAATVTPHGFAPKARRAHEACDAPATDDHALLGERVVHARRAVAPVVRRKHPPNLREKLPVLLRVDTLRAGPPGVVSAWGDAEEPTAADQTHERPLRVEEGEDVRLRTEQNRM